VNRVFVVLLALVATSAVASVAQERPAFDPHSLKPSSGSRPISGSDNPGLGHDAAHCAVRQALHPGETINKCPVADPPPPPPPPQPPPPPPPPAPSPTCGSAPAGGGTVSIAGQVYLDAAPWPGLAGWCIQLSGPVSGSVTTDASGNYVFSGLPAGTYTVCEVLQANYHETYPADGQACAGGFGYSMTLMDGSGASFIDFANLSP
jgi:hypothetical protein